MSDTSGWHTDRSTGTIGKHQESRNGDWRASVKHLEGSERIERVEPGFEVNPVKTLQQQSCPCHLCV